MGRAPCCDKVGLRKGAWTPEEDQKLLAYIQSHGHGSWRALPKQAGMFLIHHVCCMCTHTQSVFSLCASYVVASIFLCLISRRSSLQCSTFPTFQEFILFCFVCVFCPV
jgi:hypothetical protein